MLEDGQVRAELTLEVSLATNPFGRPTSLAPDLWWGVTPRLTLGLIHSHASVDQIDAGASFCLRDAELGCDRTYRGSGLDARYLVLDGPVEVAPRLRALVRGTDPFEPAITVGALARWRHGTFAIVGDPYLQLGLANRGAGNRAQLWLPLYGQWSPLCAWTFAVHTGWNSELATIRDGWHIPLALSARVAATSFLDIGVEAGFSTLLGPQNNVKQRAAMLTVAWHD